MTQFCCYNVWDGSHEKHRRITLLLSIVDLILTASVITYVAISLYYAATLDTPTQMVDDLHSKINAIDLDLLQDHEEDNDLTSNPPQLGQSNNDGGDETEIQSLNCGNFTNESDNCLNETHSAKLFPTTPYFQVVGSRISKSIQLIIYTCQLFMTVVLVRALIRTDTHLMRTWLMYTEIITTIVLLILILHLFGDFVAETVILTMAYLTFKFIIIRTIARYIRRTEIELTQFGSIVEI